MRNINELMCELEEWKICCECMLWEVVCEIKNCNMEDLDDRLLLKECEGVFNDSWSKELYEGWLEMEEVFSWLYDMEYSV